MQAILTASEISFGSAWYPDSGGTNHVTRDAENVMSKFEYDGQQRVLVEME